MDKTLNILSLDLDWFNGVHYYKLRRAIRDFFECLNNRCTLPDDITLITDHHYLYPWCLSLLQSRNKSKVDVINIDDHHDFYYLQGVDFSSKAAKIDCGNFFAFMAHENILRNYTWVTGGDVRVVRADRLTLMKSVSQARSKGVLSLADRINVHCSGSMSKVITGQHFDAFTIVKSPGYTTRQKTVYKTVEDIVGKRFPKSVRRNKCRADYRYSQRHEKRKLFKV